MMSQFSAWHLDFVYHADNSNKHFKEIEDKHSYLPPVNEFTADEVFSHLCQSVCWVGPHVTIQQLFKLVHLGIPGPTKTCSLLLIFSEKLLENQKLA